jgi:chorismate synthase
MDMGEDDIRELFRLVRGLETAMRELFEDMRKENIANLERCQDKHCDPRHADLEEKVKENTRDIRIIDRKVYAASAVVTAVLVVAQIIIKII